MQHSVLRYLTVFTLIVATAAAAFGFGLKAPRNFQAVQAEPTALLQHAIVLSWQRPDTQATFTGYSVYRAVDQESAFTAIAQTSGSSSLATGFADTGAAPGHRYSYYVTAWYGPGTTNESDPSDSVSVTFRFPPPPPPGNLIGAFVNGTVTLKWSLTPGPSTPPSGQYFQIYRRLSSDTGFAALDTTSMLQYTDHTITVDSIYFYFVTAVVNDSIQSRPSNTVEVQTAVGNLLPPPGGLNAQTNDSGAVLTWHSPNAPIPVSSYRVYRRGITDTGFTQIGSTSATRYLDATVLPNSQYAYFVTAIYVDSTTIQSLPSNIAYVTTGGGGLPPPPAPKDLVGKIEHGNANLNWQQPQEISIARITYDVFRKTPADSGFFLLGSTSYTQYIDTTINLGTTSTYYVTAVYGGPGSMMSGPSNMIQLPAPPPAIRFTSVPPLSGVVNVVYQYSPTDTVTVSGHTVVFSLPDGPRGMSVDSSTGTIQWTPQFAGMYNVTLEAQFADSLPARAVQEFTILVLNGAPAQLRGIVQNQGNVGIVGAHIQLFDVAFGQFCLQTQADSTGHYHFSVLNPATYLIQVFGDSGSGYAPQWYNGASNARHATPYTITSGAQDTLNFTLLPIGPPPPVFMLSGTVTDSSGHPVKGTELAAFIAGAPAGPAVDPGNSDNRNGLVRHTTTDSLGNYQLSLQAGSYIVGASKEGYDCQFWKDEPSPLQANVLVLGSDTTGINFDLSLHSAQAKGAILGTLRSAADSSSLPGLIVGFRRAAADSGYSRLSVATFTDSLGNYALKGLRPGYYVVLAIPHGDFMHTFYSLNGGTPFIDSATALQVNGDTIEGTDIYAQPDTLGGLNTFSGHVNENNGGGRSTMSVTPINGAIVTVTTSTGTPVSSVSTASDGSFAVNGLGEGTYNVTYQNAGDGTSSSQVTLSYSNNAPTTDSATVQLNASTGPPTPLGLVNVNAEWNLLSLPVTVSNSSSASIFPNASTGAFSFNAASGYVSSSTLTAGSGFWIKFPVSSSFTLTGTAINSQTINVTEGWNLVGSISTNVSAASVTTTPSGMIASNFFGYSGSYAVATTLEGGSGYWVKSSGNGSLTISSSASAPKTASKDPLDLSKYDALVVKDATGKTQSLYFGVGSSKTIIGSQMELPPVPPVGAFDARFTSNQMLQLVESGKESTVDLVVSATKYPVTISAGTLLSNVVATLDVDGKATKLSRGTTVTVSKASSIITLKIDASGTGLVPAQFALEQNYPNPFNPTTSIRYALPVDSKVTLRIYNILGQEVATLENGIESSGYRSIQWNATNYASGVYFYRLEASGVADASKSFVQVKKLVLVK